MRHPSSSEASGSSAQGREAASSASRPTPLTLVSGAVAGDDVLAVAATTAAALHCPVAIAIPALGLPVVAPEQALDDATLQIVGEYARAAAGGADLPAMGETGSSPIVDAVPVRLADATVGIVAALSEPGTNGSAALSAPERHAWLEAAATAASVTELIRDAHGAAPAAAAEVDLLAELAAGSPDDLPHFLSRARRLGVELGSGAVALAGRTSSPAQDAPATAAGEPALIAVRGPGRLLGVCALDGDGTDAGAQRLAQQLTAAGWTVSRSAPRRDPALLHAAVAEAELLAEIAVGADGPDGVRDTYRLLIGVLLRDRGELQELERRTVSPLADYDERHDTELLATLRAFLAHDGSTETAEAMALHRHTVGYRLARVHEVSGLSPYESDGRERLSLGIKAQEILAADERRNIQH
jgi:hypothetical protein